MLKKLILLIVLAMILATVFLLCMYLEPQKSENFQGTEITEAAETAQTEETQKITITETHAYETAPIFDDEYENSTVMTESENIQERETTAATEPPSEKPVVTNPQETEPKQTETVEPNTQAPEETVPSAPEDEWGVGRG